MFKGFTPETVDFLWGIRLNNNREWFLQHKKQYVEHLYEPMKALGAELFQPFLEKPGDLLKVSRIYRDARMHPAVPYKESLWICIRKDVQWWAENPCLFFEICPEGIRYGFLLWSPSPAYMEAFRQKISAKPETFLKLVQETEDAVGLPLSASVYQRPKPTEDKRLEPYFAWKKNITCIFYEDFSEQTFGPDLKDRVGDVLKKMIPIYDYFNEIQTATGVTI